MKPLPLLLTGLLFFLSACGADRGETPSDVTTQPGAGLDPTVTVPTETATAIDTPEVEPPTASPAEPTSTDDGSAAETVASPSPAPTLGAPQSLNSIRLAPVADGFRRPTYLSHAGDERLFVVEQAGLIHIVQNGQRLPDPFLDIEEHVLSTANEQGLLSVAFHPHYAVEGEPGYGQFFINYTAAAPDTGSQTVIARYQVGDDPNQADPASREVILTVEQPYGNHNGGQLQFGPDGYLYVGMGDGGSGGDPHGHGQNVGTLLGALLRLDVDGGAPYAIPADNPFANRDDARGEIWAYGLRNPWRFSFDRLTGELYLADVGQRIWEEVNVQPGDRAGQNYGWNIMEGNHCFQGEGCDSNGLVLPVAEYDHSQGCSVTGGYVYRGSQFPALTGWYFFADYCSGLIWALARDANGQWVQRIVNQSDYQIASFGEDANGELYLVAHGGEILQIQP